MNIVALIESAHQAARAGRAAEARAIVDQLRTHTHSDVQLAVRMLDVLTGKAPVSSAMDRVPKLNVLEAFPDAESYIEDDPAFAQYQSDTPRVWPDDEAVVLFMRGRFAEAYEKAFAISERAPPVVPGSAQLRLRSGRTLPRWCGEHVRRIVYMPRGGLGDDILAVRWVPALIGYCDELTVITDKPVIPLLQHAFPTVRAVSKTNVSEALNAADAYATPLDAAHLAGAGFGEARWLCDVPAVDHGPGFHVGLVWSGSDAAFNVLRSCPIKLFAPLRELPGITWHSLMHGDKASECPAGFVDHSRGLHSFMDTARIVAGLDLVVTIDSSVANLCGSMGAPVWVLAEADGDPRWRNPAWFPSGRVFRQDRVGEWAPVIARCRQALCELRYTSAHDAFR